MAIRMSDFKKDVVPVQRDIPSWVCTETIRKLYQAALEIHNGIEVAINNNETLSIRERQIALRNVALRCQMSPSILHTRRQPELVNFIQELNQSLSDSYASAQAKAYSSGRKLKKIELIKENKLLKEEIARLNNLTLADSFNQAIHNLLVQKSRQAALTIQNLRAKIEALDLVISKQADQNRRYMDLASSRTTPSDEDH